MEDRTKLMQILEKLATGDIDSAQAARLIDAMAPAPAAEIRVDENPYDGEVLGADNAVLRRERPDDSEQEGGRPQFATFLRDAIHRAAAGGHPSAPQINRVAVRAVGRRVQIVGDPAIATVSVTGPHLLRRAGDVIEVTSDGDIGPSLDGFSLIRPPHTLDDLRTMGLGKQLVVHVNPAVVVDAEVTGGSLRIGQVPELGRIRVTAGSMRCSDAAVLDDCLVQMGSASIEGCFTRGRSRVRAESGSVTVRLDPGSQVAVRAEAQMGGISWPGDQSFDEYVVGTGAARLDLAVVMGHATVKLRLTPEEEAAAEDARGAARQAADEARAEARRLRRAARAAREAARDAARKARDAVAEQGESEEDDAAATVAGDAANRVENVATDHEDGVAADRAAAQPEMSDRVEAQPVVTQAPAAQLGEPEPDAPDAGAPFDQASPPSDPIGARSAPVEATPVASERDAEPASATDARGTGASSTDGQQVFSQHGWDAVAPAAPDGPTVGDPPVEAEPGGDRWNGGSQW